MMTWESPLKEKKEGKKYWPYREMMSDRELALVGKTFQSCNTEFFK